MSPKMKCAKFLCFAVLCFFYFLVCLLCPALAGDADKVELKDWLDYTDREKEILRARWTDEKIEAVVAALKESKGMPLFIDSLPSTEEFLPARRNDLRGINLSGRDLQGVVLSCMHLEGADLNHSHLECADLTAANLNSADLRGTNLKLANLTRANLQHADLMYADLEGATLGGANLQWALLYEANLQQADLHYTILGGTLLYRPNLEKTLNYEDIIWKKGYVGEDLITYRDLKRLYTQRGVHEIVSEFHFWENSVRTNQSSFISEIVRLFFLEWTYGYGSRPIRLAWYSLVVISFFGLLYAGLTMDPRGRSGIYVVKRGRRGERQEVITFRKGHLLIDCFYFSLLSFATFGYGALQPRQWLQFFRIEPVEYKPVGRARVYVGLEAALGIYIFALLVTVLFGRG